MLNTSAASIPSNVFSNPFGLGSSTSAATSHSQKPAGQVASRVYKHLTDDEPRAGTGPVEVTLVGGVEQPDNCQYRYKVAGSKKVCLVDAVMHGTIGTEDGKLQARFATKDGFRAYSDKELLACAASQWNLPWYMALQMARCDTSGSAALSEVWSYELDPSRTRTGGALVGSVDRPSALQFIRAFRPHLLARVLLLEKFGTLTKAAEEGFVARRVKRDNGRWVARVDGEAVLPPVSTEDYSDKQVFADYQVWVDSEQKAYDLLFDGLLAWASAFKLQDFCGALQNSGYEESFDQMRRDAETRIWSTQKMEAWESGHRQKATRRRSE